MDETEFNTKKGKVKTKLEAWGKQRIHNLRFASERRLTRLALIVLNITQKLNFVIITFNMSETYHIRATKDYAVSLIELLKKDGAIEELELQQFELSDTQKAAIDNELDIIANNPDYLQSWEEVKQRFKKS